MNTAYLLLGSNMGDSRGLLQEATEHIRKNIGAVIQQSSFYRTASWGIAQQPDFLNQVLVIETLLAAEALLQSILAIETGMGRVRTVKNASRIIDIDLLFYNAEIIRQEGLIVPHPEIPNRRFVLVPLKEVAPSYVHPVLRETVQELLVRCKDVLRVDKI